MNIFYIKFKFQIQLLIFATVWMIFLNFILQLNFQNTVYPDSEDYIIAAKNLFIFHRGHPNRTILMAFITGLPFLFSQNETIILNWSLITNLFCWLGSILILFSILKNYVNQKTAFYYTVFFILCVGNAAYVFHLLTETIFTFMLLLFFYFLKQYFNSKKFFYLSIALSILILSMLIKPSSKIIAVIVILYFSRILFLNFKSRAIIVLYFSLSLVLVQALGIKYQFGNFTISYIDVVTAHNYLFSKAKCIENGTVFSQVGNPRADYLFSMGVNMEAQNQIAKNDRADQLKNNKINIIKAYFSNLKGNILRGTFVVIDTKNVLKTSFFDFSKRIIYLTSFAQNLFLTLIGLILGIFFTIKYKMKDLFLVTVSFFIFYIVGTSAISSDQGDRFHIVIYPIILILIAKFTQNLIFKPISEPLHK